MKSQIMVVKILVLKLKYIMFVLNFILNIYEFDLIYHWYEMKDDYHFKKWQTIAFELVLCKNIITI